MNYRTLLVLLAAVALLQASGCNSKKSTDKTMTTQTENPAEVSAPDSHSYSNPQEVAVSHLDLNIEVLFDQKILKGTATYK